MERLDDFADPGRLALVVAASDRVGQLGHQQAGDLGGNPSLQRVRIEPHEPHAIGQVGNRLERDPDPVASRDPLDVLALEPAEFVGLGVVRITRA